MFRRDSRSSRKSKASEASDKSRKKDKKKVESDEKGTETPLFVRKMAANKSFRYEKFNLVKVRCQFTSIFNCRAYDPFRKSTRSTMSGNLNNSNPELTLSTSNLVQRSKTMNITGASTVKVCVRPLSRLDQRKQ